MALSSSEAKLQLNNNHSSKNHNKVFGTRPHEDLASSDELRNYTQEEDDEEVQEAAHRNSPSPNLNKDKLDLVTEGEKSLWRPYASSSTCNSQGGSQGGSSLQPFTSPPLPTHPFHQLVGQYAALSAFFNPQRSFPPFPHSPRLFLPPYHHSSPPLHPSTHPHLSVYKGMSHHQTGHHHSTGNAVSTASERVTAVQQRQQHVKKPLNAFMIFMKEQRPRVVAECTLKESAAINQILGRRWHGLSREEQAKYYEKARQEKELHSKLFPNWSARENYGGITRKRKRRKTTIGEDGSRTGAAAKKCRAVYGLDRQEEWCKPCRRKKKCVKFLTDDGAHEDSGSPPADDPHSPPSLSIS